MKNLSVTKIISISIASLLFISCTPKKDVNTFEAMNTFMTISCYGSNPSKVNKQLQEQILNLESYLSTTKEDSDISKINHSNGTAITVHPETFELISFTKTMAEKTKGALNPALYPITSAWGFTTGNYHVPADDEIKELLNHTDYSKIQLNESDKTVSVDKNMMLDLGAVGKGYAGDLAIQYMKSKGVKSAILDLGGNIQTLGNKPDGSMWTIGIKNPWGGEAVAGLKITNQVVITSGGYERYFTGDDNRDYIHIFDGNTGRPVSNDVASMTIVCDSGLYGDSLSTALFVMGSVDAIKYWKKNPDFQFIIIKNDGSLLYSKPLDKYLQPMANFNSVTIVE